MQIVRIESIFGGTNGYMGVIIYSSISIPVHLGKILESLILAK